MATNLPTGRTGAKDCKDGFRWLETTGGSWVVGSLVRIRSLNDTDMAHRRHYRRHRNVDNENENNLPSTTEELQSERAAEEAAAAAFQSIPALSAEEADPSGVREAKLARARALIADPGYPPKGVMDSVATLLANHLQPGAEE